MKTLYCLCLITMLTACTHFAEKPTQYGTRNVGHASGRLWRSAVPSVEFLTFLSTNGVTRVVDLREKPDALEASACSRVGLEYLSVPMLGLGEPDPAAVGRAVGLVESNPGSTLVHCQHGADRTGVVVAELRRREGWSGFAALAEAQSYGLSPFLPRFRSFILRELVR